MTPADVGTERHAIFEATVQALCLRQRPPVYRVWWERDHGRPTRRLLSRDGLPWTACAALAARLNGQRTGWTARVRPASC